MPFLSLPGGRKVVPLIVASTPLPIDDNRLYPVVSAKSDDTIHYFQSATQKDCLKACEEAWKAFSQGSESEGPRKDVGVDRRRNLLNRIADMFVEREEELLNAQMEETSCDMQWAKINVDTTVQYVRETAACVSCIRGTIPPNDKPGTMAFVYKRPIGPILVIPP